MHRNFVTPEGVDLGLDLSGAGTRAAAFLIDAMAILAILIAITVAILTLMTATHGDALVIVWLIGAFLLRNGWFVLFEIGGRGATPGKRALGIRVVAQDGARLTGGAVIARNAMREVEVFLPLTFLALQAADGTADAFLVIFALSWSGIFLFFPLFNRDRLRMGDIVAGTWVVRAVGRTLAAIWPRRGRTARSATRRSISTANMNSRCWRRCCAPDGRGAGDRRRDDPREGEAAARWQRRGIPGRLLCRAVCPTGTADGGRPSTRGQVRGALGRVCGRAPSCRTPPGANYW